MRTLVSTAFVALCLAASPALAQQHPWAGSSTYTSTMQDGHSATRAYGRVHRGDTEVPVTRPATRATTDELYGACESSHPVFSCPGTM